GSGGEDAAEFGGARCADAEGRAECVTGDRLSVCLPVLGVRRTSGGQQVGVGPVLGTASSTALTGPAWRVLRVFGVRRCGQSRVGPAAEGVKVRGQSQDGGWYGTDEDDDRP